MPEKPSVTLPGTVDKIIPAVTPTEADTVQIGLESPHHLCRDVRIENTLTDESGGQPVQTESGGTPGTPTSGSFLENGTLIPPRTAFRKRL